MEKLKVSIKDCLKNKTFLVGLCAIIIIQVILAMLVPEKKHEIGLLFILLAMFWGLYSAKVETLLKTKEIGYAICTFCGLIKKSKIKME